MVATYLTRQGYEKLRQDLEGLRRRKVELSKEIGEAAEKGDLRENAEYTSAKERQAEILRRIAELEEKLKSTRLIEELKTPANEVRIGVRVSLQDLKTKQKLEYALVGSEEADFASGKISVNAPLAQGLLGRKVGEKVEVPLPAGSQNFKILKIERL